MKTIYAGIAALFLAAAPAAAETDYPQQTVRILVGFTAGTSPDIVARLLAERFAARWGKPVVVEDVTGAGGNIACDRVAHAPADGHTLVMCGNGSLTIAPSLYVKLPYDPVKDFAPIARVFVANNILAVPLDTPAKSLPELVALARAQPGQLTYAHAGIGSSQHLAGELFKSVAHLDIRPVAYRGSTAYLADLVAGRVTFSFVNIANGLPLVREGKLRGFAVSSLKRAAAAPDLPTLDESGYPGFDAVPWFGLMAPAGTPAAVIDKVHRDTVAILGEAEARQKLEVLGIDLILGDPAEFAATIRTETPRWAELIKAAGIKAIE
ncbi:MAG TPA: tripartite tricarboxylate transporter substrate binding protein [Xanthobacteraceae bacterium]|nr:tripartite tricarboxylate transporter substrate binding protein [Xanthobacteraceae bacterium]